MYTNTITKRFSALEYSELGRTKRYFRFGQGLSLLETWMQRTALQWLVYSITKSSFAIFDSVPWERSIHGHGGSYRELIGLNRSVECGFCTPGMILTAVALLKELEIKKGEVLSNSFAEYLILTVVDAPEIDTIILEKEEEMGPFVAKGMAE